MRTVIALLIAVSAAVTHGDEGPKLPGLKVLEKFVGTWDCDVVTKPAIWTPKEQREKTVEINELVLDGWFLQGCSKTRDGKTQAMLMNSYDPVMRQYRIWKFVPGGACEELIGQWDEATATLTIATTAGDGVTTKAAFHVIDKDHREYNVTAKDADGKTYLDIHGTVTFRRFLVTSMNRAEGCRLKLALFVFG